MKQNRGIPWGIWVGLAIALVLVLAALFVLQRAEKSRAELPIIAAVPPFQFTESSGRSFGRQDLQGKISVVDFIFTRCQTICPDMAQRMSALYHAFQGNDGIQFVSISVDPEYDTPEVLRQYALEHGVTDDRWVFLHGPINEVTSLCERGFLLPADNLPADHSGRFILVDRQGQIRGYYDFDDDSAQALLKTHISQLYKIND